MDISGAKSSYVEVLGSKLHYWTLGSGVPILFVHSVPTSSLIWRHVMELLSASYQCIAVDQIGFGYSDKPNIQYTANDYLNYLTAFIEAIDLKDFIIVTHGWGSLPGLSYAMTHQQNIAGLVLYESYLRPVLDWSMMSLPMQELAAEIAQEHMLQKITDTDFFIDHLLPRSMLSDMSETEIDFYKKSLSETKNRQPLIQCLLELPTGYEPSSITDLMKNYSKALEKSDIPKLLLYGIPGYNTTIATVAWAKEHLPHLTINDVGPSLHFAQQTNSMAFAEAILKWIPETA